MIEPDITVDKGCHPELCIILDCIERNWIFEDHSIKIVGCAKRQTIQVDGNGGWDRSHIQEGLEG